MLDGGTLNYFAVPWGIVNNPLPLFAVVVVEAALIGAVETYRCGDRVFCVEIVWFMVIA